MILTFEYKLRDNPGFEEKVQTILNTSRFIYNAALEERIGCYRRTGKTLTYYDQCKELTVCRRDLPEIGSLLLGIGRDALGRVDLAYRAFFRRVKAGQTPGFPRFKGRDRYRSFSQDVVGRNLLKGDVLTVPGAGACRVRLSRKLPDGHKLRQLRITKKADGLHAALVLELPNSAPLPKTGQTVGVDMGLNYFATLSNGEHVENPRYLRRAARALKRSQQVLSRTRKHSANRAKARQRFALKHLKVQRCRANFHHKTANDLVKRFDSIQVEDLKILNMMKNGKLAKSIGDVAWGQFFNKIAYKAENAGRRFDCVDPRFTSRACSSCGHRQDMPLNKRIFKCERCGLELQRDHNAAINVGKGIPKRKACGVAVVKATAKQERVRKEIATGTMAGAIL